MQSVRKKRKIVGREQERKTEAERDIYIIFFSDNSDRSKVIFEDKLVPSENSRR